MNLVPPNTLITLKKFHSTKNSHFPDVSPHCGLSPGWKGKWKLPGATKLASQLLPLRLARMVTSSPQAQPALLNTLPLHWWSDSPPPKNSLLCRNMDSSPLTSCKEDVAWSQSPFISLPRCFQLLAPAPAMSLSVCRAPHISLQKIKLRQRKETYLALMLYRVSFFYLNLLLFNELNSHWMN